jgi:hypothetical protein
MKFGLINSHNVMLRRVFELCEAWFLFPDLRPGNEDHQVSKSWASVRFSVIDGVLNVRQEGDLVDNYWTDDRPQTLLSRFGDNFELFSWRDGVMFNYTNTPTGVVFTALGYSQHWCVKA